MVAGNFLGFVLPNSQKGSEMTNAEISKRRDAAIAQGVGMQTQIYVDRALNSVRCKTPSLPY